MTIDDKSLYQLTPAEFEKLCVEIFKLKGFKDVEHVGGPGDQGIDIVSQTDGEKIAVQVKHAKHLSLPAIRSVVERMLESTFQPERIVIMTSAELSPTRRESIRDMFENITIEYLDRSEILHVLNRHPKLQQLFLAPAQKRTTQQKWTLSIGSIGALASIFAIIFSITSILIQPTKPGLNKRIETVEDAIGNLKDLERHLIEIKEEMVETEKEIDLIEQEYAEAKLLQKLSEEEFKAVKSALQTKSWIETAINYGLGFIFGIASSLIASVVHSRIRQSRALSKNYGNT